MRKFHIMGSYHTDLAWRGDERQYASYLEQFAVVMIDLLEQNPDMTFVIEQAYHYRGLKKRRPDLVQKLSRLIAEGRIEVVGGMISTADTNVPGAESLVRNQLMGLRWFKENMNAVPRTGWLFDTFGLSAQLPQILASFGMHQMFGSRFGGEMHYDAFYAEGLDGTKALTAGRDCFSPNLPCPERARVFLECCTDGEITDRLFDSVRRAGQQGPIMVSFFSEDEVYPGRRFAEHADALVQEARANGDWAEFSLPSQYFDDLRSMENIPTVFADLNPEFTGCFAQRMQIRLQNRAAENAVLEAEKWIALLGRDWPEELHEAWWDLGFVHFHDVFTGSHPEKVYLDVISRLQKSRALADKSMTAMFSSTGKDICTVNSLPFARSEWICLPGEFAVEGAHCYISDGMTWFCAELDAFSSRIYSLTQRSAPDCFEPAHGHSVLENEFIRLTVDSVEGVTLLNKASGSLILDRVRDMLVLQGDTGSFQVENIDSPEQHAWANDVCVIQRDPHSICASGVFRNGNAVDAEWALTFRLHPGEKAVSLNLDVDWKAVGKRLRLKLNTPLYRAGDGINEIPFGVVRRRAYTPAFCRKGEWPVQRFAAIEDGENGVALINDGAPGVETLGGSMYTTLLRAPTQVYAGMVPDDSSQQHQKHSFRFAIYPYTGCWQDSDVLTIAQTHNLPMRTFTVDSCAAAVESMFSIDNPSVVLSTVKSPEDADRSGVIIRLYESSGREQTCRLRLRGMNRAWLANLAEEIHDELHVENGEIVLNFKPWQIVTIYTERN